MRDGQSGGGVGAGLLFAPGVGGTAARTVSAIVREPPTCSARSMVSSAKHCGFGEVAPPDLDQCAVPGDGHHVVLGAAFDTTVADAVHLPVRAIVQLSRPCVIKALTALAQTE